MGEMLENPEGLMLLKRLEKSEWLLDTPCVEDFDTVSSLDSAKLDDVMEQCKRLLSRSHSLLRGNAYE